MTRAASGSFRLALCMVPAWVGALISITSVIGQPWTAVVIFAYGLGGVLYAFAAGRESMKP